MIVVVVKTIEVFGKPLSPLQVVERICSRVRTRGLDAVLRYTAKLDSVRAVILGER